MGTSALRSRLLHKDLRQYGTLVAEGVTRYDLQDIWAQLPKEGSLKVSSVEWQLHLWRMELGTINDGADDDTMAYNDEEVGVGQPGADEDTKVLDNDQVGVGQPGADEDTMADTMIDTMVDTMVLENGEKVGVAQPSVYYDTMVDTMVLEKEEKVGVAQPRELGPPDQLQNDTHVVPMVAEPEELSEKGVPDQFENNEHVVPMVAEPEQPVEKGKLGPMDQLDHNRHVVPAVAQPEQPVEKGVPICEPSHQHGMATGISDHRAVGRGRCRKIGNAYSQILTQPTSWLPRLKQPQQQTLPRPRHRTPATPVKEKDAGTSSEVLACPAVDSAASGLSSTVPSARRGRALDSKTTPKRVKKPLPMRTPEKRTPEKKRSQKSRWEKLNPADVSVQQIKELPVVSKQKPSPKRVSSARPRKKAKLSNDVLFFLNKTIGFLDIDEEHSAACEPSLRSGLLDLAAKKPPSTEMQVPALSSLAG